MYGLFTLHVFYKHKCVYWDGLEPGQKLGGLVFFFLVLFQ